MDDNDLEEEIPDGALLMKANNILGSLGYSEQLDDEDDLFLDDFYLSIIGGIINLIPGGKFDLTPGETPEEKEENLTKLIEILKQMVDVDLSSISPHNIIFKHDKVGAHNLLELIELILSSLNEGEDNENSDVGDSNKKTNKNTKSHDSDLVKNSEEKMNV